MEKFIDIQDRAIQRKGSQQMLNSLLSKPLSSKDLIALSDDIWLEEFTRKIFQSGFYWSVINNKWPGFREVFWDFNITKLLMMSPEMYEQRASDERIVRNYNKVKTIAVNTMMIHSTAQEHGSFSQFINDWSSEDIIGLWAWLKKHGARLGGNTGAYSLRVMGKDTFVLSRDAESYFRSHKIIDGGLQTKKSLTAIQAFFNEMQQQSGLSLQEISQTLSYSVGDNTVGFSQ
ncbi:DNA-3-methyladenine glycosylase I [Pseudoalteromonas sp. C2R02]|uniref:DNA-3-methyladenine glycosylase I n=1 Tax=Pseudoalteromonas sp. C2R02 TaxID=2841565 RepID=UPI001C0917D1|nr:DNA-3-methyladenine glycosylase I [Pseudoalteromonas sp. C2R02]MBU2968928.1 DNA-3-methyladenine glycosylase I [Pseudoalteromonas sp. C2R02]